MAATTARVLALLDLMQSGGLHTVTSLASRLEVDERTVRRSVALLVDVGVPVESVRGRYGGYRLARGYRMPPLMLTDDEAVAVVLGLMALNDNARFRLSALAGASASAKIRRVLPDRLKARTGALLDIAQFGPSPPTADTANAEILLDLAGAARAGNRVNILYRNRSGEVSERTLEPHGIAAHSGHWYVAGADSTSGEVRTFRIDRISAATTTEQRFAPPTEFDAYAAVIASVRATPWQHEVSVIVEASADHVRTAFPVGIATLTEVVDRTGSLRLTLRAERLDWVAAGLAGLDRSFVVESPAALSECVLALADRLRRSGAAVLPPGLTTALPPHVSGNT